PPMPVVSFESQAQVIDYLKKNNSYSENIQDLNPTSRGNASNVVLAAGAGQVYVAWLSTFGGLTSVKLASSFDGDNYNNATQVSAKDANASGLQMAASGKLVVL